MKRYGKSEHLWENIYSDSNIEEAMNAVMVKHSYRKGEKPHYSKGQEFMMANWDKIKKEVIDNLQNETYVLQGLNHKIIYDRKRRNLNFPKLLLDKIYFRAVYQILKPYFYKRFAHNTCNCIKGRGIQYAEKRIINIFKEHPDWYYVVTDIRHYYESINHDLIKQDLLTLFKCKKVLRFLFAAIDVYCSEESRMEEVGLAIGINMTQLLAILFRSPILHTINEKWRDCIAVEFTDDLFAAVPTKERGHEFLFWYKDICSQKKLKVKDSARVAPMTEALHMIGYEFVLGKDGKPYVRLSKRIKENMRKRVKSLNRRNVTDQEWKQQMASYYGWCKHGNCKHLMQVVFGDRYKLFCKDMKTYKEIKASKRNGEFGVKKELRTSVLDVLEKNICLEDAKEIQMEELSGDGSKREVVKVAIKFRYADDNHEPYGESSYLISGSKSLRDRAVEIQPSMPLIGTIREKKTMDGRKRYYVID